MFAVAILNLFESENKAINYVVWLKCDRWNENKRVNYDDDDTFKCSVFVNRFPILLILNITVKCLCECKSWCTCAIKMDPFVVHKCIASWFYD